MLFYGLSLSAFVVNVHNFGSVALAIPSATVEEGGDPETTKGNGKIRTAHGTAGQKHIPEIRHL